MQGRLCAHKDGLSKQMVVLAPKRTLDSQGLCRHSLMVVVFWGIWGCSSRARGHFIWSSAQWESILVSFASHEKSSGFQSDTTWVCSINQGRQVGYQYMHQAILPYQRYIGHLQGKAWWEAVMVEVGRGLSTGNIFHSVRTFEKINVKH